MDGRETAQLLIESFRGFRRMHQHVQPVVDLKHSELVILASIEQHAESATMGLKMSEVSKRLKLATPTVTELVNGLVQKGYVERSRDPADRRVVRIRLTANGVVVTGQAKEAFLQVFVGLVDYLGEERSRQLSDLLTVVSRYFHELSGAEMK